MEPVDKISIDFHYSRLSNKNMYHDEKETPGT